MGTSKGRMLARTGWQGWACRCCSPEATKGQKRAREKRQWMTADENAERIREASRRLEAREDFKLPEPFDARWF